MSRLRMWQVWMAMVVLSTGLTVVPGVAAGNTQTFTGKVSDAMCGAKQSEAGIAPADCVPACVQKGALNTLWWLATKFIRSTPRTTLPLTNSISWLGSKSKLRAQPTETQFR
jgi:hypothetical protein